MLNIINLKLTLSFCLFRWILFIYVVIYLLMLWHMCSVCNVSVVCVCVCLVSVM